MTENQIIIGLLAIICIALAIVGAEVFRLNDTLTPIANSSLVRGLASV